MTESGEVVLADVQFVDSSESKRRPALVLFEEMGNVVVAGITSNPDMKGVPLLKKDGAARDSVIKLNYIFTIPHEAIEKTLFRLGREKKKEVHVSLCRKLDALGR